MMNMTDKIIVKDIECWNNAKVVNFYVNCFNRTMTIIFRDFNNLDLSDITNILCDNYYDWQDDDKGYCCEEYILDNLPEDYKNNIMCVIYGEESEEE